jgi:endoglucanase
MTSSSHRLRLILLLFVVIPSTELVPGGSRVAVVNQMGYPRKFNKFILASQAADSFRVELTATGENVFRGPMLLWKSADAATGRTVYRGDFSALQQSGQYRVVTSHGDTSSPFVISDSVYDPVFRKALKGFYFQRCGMALLAAYAGVYQHATCHSLDGVFHSSTDTSGFHLATGGWHDAGDYGKYVVNAGITAGTLLLAYDMFPSCFSSDDLGIPESGNGVPDILDEVRYELEWFLTMQRSDGGFWFKITHAQFEGFVMPQNDSGSRYIYTVSSTATADAVAVLARAARAYAAFDAAFAQRCLDAATLGWQYLTAHGDIVPTGGFTNPSGTSTGEYGDANDTDERLWAAAELFETTGISAYNEDFQGGLLYGSQFTQQMSWGYVRPLGLLTYLRSKQAGASSAVRGDLRTSLLSYCSSQVTRRNSSGYRTVLLPGDYVWGSNSVALNAAVLLLSGVAETGDTSYVAAAADQLHYVLGVNALSRSFVTGLGENPPKQPHHRPSASDGVADPVPGLIVGGPEQYRSDAVLQALYTSSTPPALVYADSLPSYASNEIAINWNAPLVFVAGYFRGVSGPTSLSGESPQVPSAFFLEQNYPNPFNPKTVVSYQLSAVSEVRLGVYDLLGREVAILVNDRKAPGRYEVAFDGTNLSSGVYICRMNAGKYVESKKMLLTK